jgi:peptidoglycan/xylan/chitin deacetylase (PgdA/CDA1 family)
MAAFWTELDVCVVPSLLEGTPLIALEAMTRGIPVVATDVGGVGELLEGGEHGRLVAPADEVELALAIVELVRDPGKRQRLGAAGRRRVAERHLAPVATLPWLEAYAEASDPPGRRPRPRVVRSTQPCPILVYHRIAPPSRDPHGHGVTPRHFAEQMEVLRRVARPMPLSAVLAGCRSGALPERAVAVTFDDGYVSTLVEALPVLERFDVPAAIHVVTGAIGRGRELWWDELETIVLGAGPLPPVVRVTIGSTPYGWAIRESPGMRLDEEQQTWRIGERARHPRLQMLAGLHRSLQTVTPAEREQALAALAEACGVPRPSVRESHRSLSLDELGLLARSPLIELGAHTVSHPALAGLSRAVQVAEVGDSKRQLEAWLGRPVTLFAYPCWPWSCDDVSVEAVRAAGFDSAVTVHPRAVRCAADPLLVPRLLAEDENGDDFEQRLRGLLGK